MRKKSIVVAIQLALLAGGMNISTAHAAESEQANNEQKQDRVKTSEDKDNIVKVTGTRILRQNFQTTTPLITVNNEDIIDSGVSALSDILAEQVPGLEVSITNTNNQSSIGNTGLTTVNLRNLGLNRTLTLIDGRRAVSNSYNGNFISLNTIPAGMVERVEVITGGATAIYGSDAIAGVVNIITQSDKEGFEFGIRGGHTPEGGGREFTVDMDYGTNFNDDNGYLYFSTSWNRDFGVDYLDRSRAQVEAAFAYDDNSFCNAVLTVSNGFECMNSVSQSDWRARGDGIAGGVFEEGRGSAGGFFYTEDGLQTGWLEQRDGVTPNIWEKIRVPSDSFATALKMDFSLNDSTDAFFQIHYSLNESINNKSPEDGSEGSSVVYFDPTTGEPGLIAPGTISINNPFAPPEIANNAGSSISWDRRFFEVGNIITDNKRETIRSAMGLRGFVFDDKWDWELSLNLGQFQQEQHRLNELNIVRVRQALDAEYAADGVTIQCADPAARAAGCVPLNLFGEGSITPEAADWIRANPTINTKIKQTNIAGYMSGDLFELSTGSVAAAFGFDFRRDSLDLNTSEGHRNGGITFNILPSFEGEIDVYEVFGEVSTPLTKNIILDTSLRLADYSPENIGLVSSYKIGLDWNLTDNLYFRANYSRAQRAPNINELLSPPRGDFDRYRDICDEVTATSTAPGHDNCRLEPTIAAVIAADGQFIDDNNGYSPNAGNPSLTEETADTYTAGLVYTSPGIEGINFAIDYYDIAVEDVISDYGNGDILRECYASTITFGDANPFCNEITRNAEGQIIEILQRQYNLNELRTRGYDVAFSYNIVSDNYGDFNFMLNWNHVLEHSDTFEGNDGIQVNDNVGFLNTGVFEDQAHFNFTWKYNDFRLRWTTSYKSSTIDSQSRLDDYNQLYADNRALFDSGQAEVPAYLFLGSFTRHNLNLSYDLDLSEESQLRLYAGARNIFDNKGAFLPNFGDVSASTAGNSSYLLGAGIGRYVYLGFEYKF